MANSLPTVGVEGSLSWRRLGSAVLEQAAKTTARMSGAKRIHAVLSVGRSRGRTRTIYARGCMNARGPHLIRLLCVLAVAAILGACGNDQVNTDPGPQQPDETTTTTEADGDDDTSDVVTDDSTSSTSTTIVVVDGDGDDVGVGDGDGDDDGPTTTFIVDESSLNANAFIELADAGLVLDLDAQECADTSVDNGMTAGLDRIDALIGAVKECATPAAVDDFSSELLSAGGAPLPPTEAACVASTLRSDDDYRPFWVALLDVEPFDFLAVDVEVQDRYLDLFADCVSVGRALSEQLDAGLSAPTIGCIDALYTDREFVRTSIEADLSGDPDELARVNSQIAGCLTSDERSTLGL
jgi:hypothetical protein